jgi:hypothetical protein
MRDRMADRREVARILNLINDPPNCREDPEQPGYLIYFDGGLMKVGTGTMEYEFSDGTRAHIPVMPYLSITISFPDGIVVTIQQPH